MIDIGAKTRKLLVTEGSVREIASAREIELRFGDPFRLVEVATGGVLSAQIRPEDQIPSRVNDIERYD